MDDADWFYKWLRSRSVRQPEPISCRKARQLCFGAFGDPARSPASALAAEMHSAEGRCGSD